MSPNINVSQTPLDVFRNPNAYACFRDLIRAANLLLRNRLKNESDQLSFKRLWGLDPTLSDRRKLVLLSIPDFVRLVYSSLGEIEALDETKVCTLTLASTHEAQEKYSFLTDRNGVLVSDYNSRAFTDICLPFMYRYYSEAPDLKLHQPLLKKLYSLFETELYDNKVTIHALVPLLHFEFDGNKIILDDMVCIRKLSHAEIDTMLKFSGLDLVIPKVRQPLMLSDIQRYDAAIEIKRVVTNDSYIPVVQVANVLLCLHLLQEGSVHTSAVFSEQTSWTPYSRMISIDFPQINPVTDLPRFVLRKSDSRKVKSLWNYLNTPNVMKLETPLSRFASTYVKETDEERIIDCFIALESLFLRDTSNELSYRLALRAAALLGGRDSSRREQVFETLRLAYEVRSFIVHGKSTRYISGFLAKKKANISFRLLVANVREITRQSVVLALTKPSVFDVKELDKLVVSK